jgi:hypothetical protein
MHQKIDGELEKKSEVKKASRAIQGRTCLCHSPCVHICLYCVTKLQKQILEDEYGKDKYAEGHRLNEIIAKTGLPKERIKNWFNNQRSKVIWQRGEI